MPRVIITVPGKSAQPYRFQLDRKVVSLGRGSDNDIVIDSGSVSGRHAEMKRIEGGYDLTDVGSTNGIKIDGLRFPSVLLKNGIHVQLGDVRFDFSLTDEELVTISREKPAEHSPVISEEKAAAEEVRKEPKQEREKVLARPVVAAQASSGGGVMVLLFLVLAIAAFLTGLSIRHQKDTGQSLLKSVVNKGDVVVPAVPDGD